MSKKRFGKIIGVSSNGKRSGCYPANLGSIPSTPAIGASSNGRTRVFGTLNRGSIPFAPAHKYGARRTEYNGIAYPSAREAKYAQELDIRVRVGELASWERQKRFDLIINGTKIGHYTIDFVEINHDGAYLYTEVKGYKTRDWVLRNKVFKALYPTLPYQVVS